MQVAKIWDVTVPGHCVNAVAAYYGQFYLRTFYHIFILTHRQALLVCFLYLRIERVYCSDSNMSSGSSLGLDLLIILLPIPVLIKLKLNSKQKVLYSLFFFLLDASKRSFG